MTLRPEAEQVIQESHREERLASELRLTVKEYAARHGLHVQTVYTAIRYGRKLEGRVERPSSRTIRIVVPRESIQTLTSA